MIFLLCFRRNCYNLGLVIKKIDNLGGLVATYAKFMLKKGDLVDIISPASSITKNDLAQIKIFLQENGLKARFYNEKQLLLDKKPAHNFPSFSAQERFEQLKFALENKDSKAVWCARGGYGSSDLIQLLEKIKPAPNKMFIGFSDITALAIFLEQKWNWQIIYGPMLCQLAFSKVSQKSKKTIIDFIFGKKNNFSYKLQAKFVPKNYPKTINAKVVGGCLSVIAAHFATKNSLDFDNKILFLEDIDESGEKLDRYFCQLVEIMLATKMKPTAIVLGNFFVDIKKLSQKQNIVFAINNFAKRLQENNLNIALFEEKTNCLGHAKNMMPITIGKKATIENLNITQEKL